MNIIITITGEQLLLCMLGVVFVAVIIFLDSNAYNQGYNDAIKENQNDQSNHLINK